MSKNKKVNAKLVRLRAETMSGAEFRKILGLFVGNAREGRSTTIGEINAIIGITQNISYFMNVIDTAYGGRYDDHRALLRKKAKRGVEYEYSLKDIDHIPKEAYIDVVLVKRLLANW